MKYILVVFLAFCTISVLADNSNSLEKYSELNKDKNLGKFNSDGILEDIQKWLEEILHSVTESINEIIAKFNKIVINVEQKIMELIERAQKNLDDLLHNIEGILEDLVAQNEAAKDCVERYRPQLESIIENSKMDIEFCKQDALKQLQDIKTKFQKQIDAIRSQIDELGEILKDCYESSSNPISASRCALRKIKEIKIAVSKIISNANQAVAIASKEAGIVISTANRCVARTNSEARSQTKALLDKINDCIDVGNSHKILMLN